MTNNNHLNGLLGMAMGFYNIAKHNEEKMCKEFEERAEKCIEKYWEACKYPRKTKKRMRKEAEKDYQLYKLLAQPVLFKF